MKYQKPRPRKKLMIQRQLLGLTQQQLAKMIGTTQPLISSWERGEVDPSPYFRSKLCDILKKSPEELELLPSEQEIGDAGSAETLEELQADVEVNDRSLEREISQQQSPSYHDVNIPIPRDAFFTGREKILDDMHAQLISKRRGISILALSGIAGIGKTHIAAEYAFRYAEEYQIILWVAADTREMLVADLLRITTALDFFQRHELDPGIVIFAVKHWLQTHDGWLLIIDNVEDAKIIQDFLPQQGNGHVLLTTLAKQPISSIVPCIEIDEMGIEEGTTFLLRRTNKLTINQKLDQAEDGDRVQAETVVKEMGGLPLALDQAAAYVAETECSLAEYLDRYHKRRIALLDLRGASITEHPLSVAVTFSLLFEKVEQGNLSTLKLLHFCSFLHPVDIPLEIVTCSANFVDPALQSVVLDPHLLDLAVNTLCRYSLIRRHPATRSLSMHRLVQVILKERSDEDIQRRYAEWAVRAVAKAFGAARVAELREHAKYLPHVFECTELIHRWNLRFTESAELLYLAACNLQEHAIYKAAEPMVLLAWNTYKYFVVPNDPQIINCLLLWASLQEKMGEYSFAEIFYRYAQMLCERRIGKNDALKATIFQHLAHVYMKMGKIALAQKYCLQALDLYLKTSDESLLSVATSLHTLGLIYAYRGFFEEAEDSLTSAVVLKAQALEYHHPEVTRSVTELAKVCAMQGDIARSEELIQQAISVSEVLQRPDHPDRGHQYENLAFIRERQGADEEAEELLQKALSIFNQVPGRTQPDAVRIQKHLANFYRSRHREKEAEEYQQQWTQQANKIKFYKPTTLINFLEKNLRERGMNTKEFAALSVFVADLMEKEKDLR